MRDTRIEEQLRDVLRAEADSIPLTLSAAELEVRLRLRRSQRTNQRIMLGAAAALAIAVGVGAAVLASNRTNQSVATSPSPSAPVVVPQTSAPSASAEPTAPASALPSPRYADQSVGQAIWTFESGSIPPVTYPIECTWQSPSRVVSIFPVGEQELFGETVSFDINFGDTDAVSIYIGRDGHASYRPGPATGSVMLTGHAPDWSAATLTFTDLAPDPETADPGPLPTPADGWTKPIGGEPAAARLTGTITWACGGAPTNLPSSGPTESPGPATTPPPLPNPQLVVGDQSRRGEFGCGLSFTIDGAVTTDECGPIHYLVVGPNRTLRIHSGDRLTFRLSGSWTFRQWTVGWASETDAEAYRGTRPDSFTEKAREDSASGSSITVAGPPVGEWSIELGWRGVRGADDLQGRSYYRVVVEP